MDFDLKSLTEIVGILITVGVFHAATFRWIMTRINEVDSNAAERDHHIEDRMLTRDEFLKHMQLYEVNSSGVKVELHRLNTRIDALLLRVSVPSAPEHPREG